MKKNTSLAKSQDIVKDSKANTLLENGSQTESGFGQTMLHLFVNALVAVRSWITNSQTGFLSIKDIDRAAYYLYLGAELIRLEDKYPSNVFVFKVYRWIPFIEKHFGVVRYRAFCEKRKVLKRMSRKQAGLPEHFTGEDNGKYKLGEIATFRRFSQRELQNMKESTPPKVGA